jgi:hypothetical protein
MKIVYILLWSVVLLETINAQVVVDPTQDFLNRMSRKPDDQMLKLVAPINRNGGSEVFLTYSHNANGKAGYTWVVYAPVLGGYQRLDNLVTFRVDRLFVGTSKELGGLGLLTYSSGGAGRGTINGYVFKGTSVDEMNVADVVLGEKMGDGVGLDLMNKYFSKGVHPKIEITPADNLPKTDYH